jgi:hypothetical protein
VRAVHAAGQCLDAGAVVHAVAVRRHVGIDRDGRAAAQRGTTGDELNLEVLPHRDRQRSRHERDAHALGRGDPGLGTLQCRATVVVGRRAGGQQREREGDAGAGHIFFCHAVRSRLSALRCAMFCASGAGRSASQPREYSACGPM